MHVLHDAREVSAEGFNLRTSTWQKCEAVPSRARIQGSSTCASLNSGLERNKKKRVSVVYGDYGLEIWGPAGIGCTGIRR